MALFFRKNIFSFLFCFIFINFLISCEKNKDNIKRLVEKNNSFLNFNDINDIPDVSKTNINLKEKEPFFGMDNIYEKNEMNDNSINFMIPIFIGFILISIISIILLIIDLKEDKKMSRKCNLTINLKAYEEYKQIKNSYIARTKFFFFLFLIKNMYSPWSIIYIYNYDYPRYIRFIVSIIKYLINAFFSTFIYYMLFFYLKSDEEGPNPVAISISILFSFSFILISDLIIRYLLNYDEIKRNIFKPKLESLRKYVYYGIKKDILFNSKWHVIRNRILSYYRICGPSLLINKKLDKYGKYVNNKIKNNNGKNNSFFSLNNIIINDDKDFDVKNRLSERLLPSLTNYNLKMKETITNNFNNRLSFRENANNPNNLYIVKGVESFSFSKFGINNMKLKTLKKIEDIRNRYIINKNEITYDETLDVNSFVKTYDNLEIEALENYTYISTDKMINKLNKINASSNKLIINIFINFILLLFLMLTTQGLLHIFFQIEGNSKNMLLAFDLPMGSLLVLYLFYYLSVCIIITVRFPKHYGKKKKNCWNKLLFKLCFEKHIIYLYKMRLLLTKYHKEFEFIDK